MQVIYTCNLSIDFLCEATLLFITFSISIRKRFLYYLLKYLLFFYLFHFLKLIFEQHGDAVKLFWNIFFIC